MDEVLDFPALDLDEPLETPEEPTEAPEPAEGEEPAEDAPEGEETPAEEPADGRKVPDDVRKALKALRDSSPENAKAARLMNDVYGREQAYKAVFPSVKDAVAAQGTIATIQSFGGLEAVQNTIAEIEEIDSLLQAGDFKAIDKIMEVSGEGFSKIAPEMLNRLQTSNPDAYAAAIRPHLVSAIGASGLSEAFGAVINALDIAATPGASAEFKAKFDKQANEGLGKIYQYLQNLGKTAPATAAAPGADKLTERETAVAAKEAAAFNTEVGNLANGKMTSSLSKAVTPYLRGVKLDPAARTEFTQSVYNEIAALAKADKDYQRGKDALFKSRNKDAGKIADHMSAKFDSVVGTAVKTVAGRPQWKALLKSGGAAPAARTGSPAAAVAPGGTGSLEKPILVKELPPRSDVDWNKTTEDMMMRGVRVLKSGKAVRLDR